MSTFHIAFQKVCACGRVIASRNLTQGLMASTVALLDPRYDTLATIDPLIDAMRHVQYDDHARGNAMTIARLKRNVCEICVLVKP